jgi:hypothetical protein
MIVRRSMREEASGGGRNAVTKSVQDFTPVREIVVALLGSVSILLLDFPFLVVTIGSALSFDLTSGFQLAINGSSPNLAEIVSLSGYWGLVLPGGGLRVIASVPSVWLILGGGLVSEAVSFTFIVLRLERNTKATGALMILGGLLILVGSLVTYIVISVSVSQIAIPYVTFHPGSVVIVEFIFGLLIATLGKFELNVGLRNMNVQRD